MRLTEHKVRVNIDEACQLTDDRVGWSIRNHYLDFILTVSSELGLWAAVPKYADHHFTFELDLQTPIRAFRAKYGKLGFDPKGRMLYIGRANCEDVYLAFCPKSFLDDPHSAEEVDLRKCTGETALSPKHYRMAVLYIATALQNIPGSPYTVTRKYEAPMPPLQSKLKDHTNVL